MDIIKETVYHGTTSERAQSILQKGFIPSSKNVEWLGHGVYFFKYREDAKWWAKDQTKLQRNEGQSAVVIEAPLAYRMEQLLDLDDRAQLQSFAQFWDDCLQSTEKTKLIRADFNKQRKRVWCAACNLYREAHPDIIIIKYTFHWNSGAYIYFPNQQQLCVSDDKIIGNLSISEV